MSDPVLDALQQRATGAAYVPPTGDPVIDALSHRAAGNQFADEAPTKAAPRGWWERTVGAGEAALNAGTGAIAGLGGGLNYLAILGEKNDPEGAKAVQEATQNALTYQPRTEAGKEYAGAVGNAMSWLGPKEGEWAGEKVADVTGSPLAGAAVNTGINAIPMALGMRAGRGKPAPKAGEAFSDSVGASAAAPDLQFVSPGIRAAVEKAVKEGQGINRDALQRHMEAEQMGVRLSEGQATSDPVRLSFEQNNRGKYPELAQFFADQSPALKDKLDTLRADTSPTVVHQDHIQNGQTLIDAYKQYDAPVRENISALYKQLEEANGGQFPVNGAAFVKAADAALAKKMKGRYVPSQVAGDLADFRDGGPMTFENFENLRTNLAAEARKADRSGDGNAAMAVGIVREALESLPMEGEAAAIKPIADAARSASKARFDRMREDPAYRAAVDDTADIGELSPLADQFVNKYVVKGKAAHIQKMRETLANDATATETIAAGALNYLKQRAGINLYSNEGNFSSAGYNKALQELMPKAQQLLTPELAEQLQTLGNVAQYTTHQPRGSFVNNSNTFTAQLADHAGTVLEGVANVKAGGIPVGTFARKKLQARSERKIMRKATEPGAGVGNLGDLGKKK